MIHNLEEDSLTLIQWYRCNYLKLNPDKWHLLLSDTSDLNIVIGNECISSSPYVKILGVNFNKLNFNIHLTKLCKQAGQKLHSMISNYLHIIPFLFCFLCSCWWLTLYLQYTHPFKIHEMELFWVCILKNVWNVSGKNIFIVVVSSSISWE